METGGRRINVCLVESDLVLEKCEPGGHALPLEEKRGRRGRGGTVGNK